MKQRIKYTYTELLVMSALILVIVIVSWAVIDICWPTPPQSTVYTVSDGPEMQKAWKKIQEQLKKDAKP